MAWELIFTLYIFIIGIGRITITHCVNTSGDLSAVFPPLCKSVLFPIPFTMYQPRQGKSVWFSAANIYIYVDKCTKEYAFIYIVNNSMAVINRYSLKIYIYVYLTLLLCVD